MKRVLLSLGLVAMLAALPASASTFVAMSDEALVASSQAVVVGEVVQVDSFWNQDGTAVLTEATFQVGQTFAGSAPATVKVRTFGGSVGDVRIEAIGFPTFEVGEHMVLFLEQGAEGTYRVTGYQLGQYRVRKNETGVVTAYPALEHGVQLLQIDGTPAPAPKVMPLHALAERVRGLAAARSVDPIVK